VTYLAVVSASLALISIVAFAAALRKSVRGKKGPKEAG